MKLRWAALSVVLALSALMPANAAGQTTEQPSRPNRIGKLGQNYPNPFNPETWIPFAVDSACAEPGRQYRVTLRIYNVLTQVVGVPVLLGGPSGGEKVENLVLTCGSYVAYWNGKYLNSDRDVASAVYLYRLDVDGRFVETRKFFVTK